MTKPKHCEDDIIVHLIVIASIIIEILIDTLKCLTSLNSASPTPTLGNQDLQSSDIKSTKSGSIKTQPLSPSTKPRSTTAVQKKAVGFMSQDIPVSPTASSTRSKRSKTSSTTVTSTEPGISPISGSRRRSRTTTLTSPTTTLKSTPQKDLITNEQAAS